MKIFKNVSVNRCNQSTIIIRHLGATNQSITVRGFSFDTLKTVKESVKSNNKMIRVK